MPAALGLPNPSPAAVDMPAALALANQYLADVAGAGASNVYGSPASIQYVNGKIQATTECASFVRLVLENAYPSVTGTVLHGLTGSSMPNAAHWYDGIANNRTSGPFQLHDLAQVSAIRPGDILAAKYQQGSITGHTMLVNSITPVASQLGGIIPGVAQVNSYRVQVIDSTSSPHNGDPAFPDSRAASAGTGIGSGYINVYEDAQTGALVGWTWNTQQTTAFQCTNSAGANYRPMAAGYLSGPGT
jgi:hypothetical protein